MLKEKGTYQEYALIGFENASCAKNRFSLSPFPPCSRRNVSLLERRTLRQIFKKRTIVSQLRKLYKTKRSEAVCRAQVLNIKSLDKYHWCLSIFLYFSRSPFLFLNVESLIVQWSQSVAEFCQCIGASNILRSWSS